MKKILSFILVISIVFSLTAVNAAFNDIAGIQSENDIKVLEGIGVIDSGESYRPESYITRGDFFIMTARLLGSAPADADEAVAYLSGLGIVSGYGNGEFKCESAITYNEALKMLVVALGYEQNALLQNGWPTGYVTVASSLDLTEPGDKITGDGNVTRGMAATLLLRAGNTETAQVTYRDGNSVMGPTGGDTLLYEYHKITKISGIINANSATSLSDPSGIALNEFRIGTDYIDAGNTNAKEYLGYFVDAYCVEDVGYKALAVVPSKKKNSVLRISAGSDITASGSLSEFEVSYYTNEGKTKRAKVADYDVIYNGASYPGFVLADMSIDSGEVILLDNDADGIYEVVFINEYETYVVKAVNTDDEKVYDLYGRVLDLSADTDQLQIVDNTGNLTDITAIFENDVLSVKKSKNGKVINVRIVKKTVSGTITGTETVNGWMRLTIDGTKYYVSKDFESLVHVDKIEPYTGLEAVFHLDAEGKIAHISTGISTGWEYGYILSANVGDDDGKIYFKLYTTGNSFERFEVQERVNVDGANKKVTALTPADSSWMSRQLIRYQAEGNVLKKIDTAVQGANETDDTLSVVSGINSAKYASTPKLFYDGNETVLGGTNDTVVFTIPTSSAYYDNELYYSVGGMSWFTNETTYNNLDAFNVNDAGIAEVIVRNQNDGVGIGAAHSSFVFVESISTVLNADGEAVQQLAGVRQSGGAVTLQTDKDGVIDTSQIGLGDVVRIREKSGKLVYAEKTVDFDTDYPNVFAYSSASGTSYYEALKIACGYITYSDSTHLVLSNSDESKNVTFTLGSAPLMLCDVEEEDVRSISASDLAAYLKSVNTDAKAYIITKNGSVTAVMVRVV